MALARRARETSDVSFYAKADDALNKSLALKSDNYEALKARAWLLLGRHEFSKALDLAQKLQKQNPDDVTIYGYLTDANVELGDYEAAEKAAQWMLDLRPGNVPGLTRAAYLRELFGDPEGAIELMKMAYDATAPTEREDRAWILTQIGHMELIQGNVANAEAILSQALTVFPDYHYALGNLAKVRVAQQRDVEAVELLRVRYRNAPHAESLFELAQALEAAGQRQEAAASFRQFEQKSLAESQLADNSNHELVSYYADYAHRPADALRVAQLELARRQDVNTLDAYAWALYANKRYAEAARVMQRVLAVGVREVRFYTHAVRIAAAAGKSHDAKLYASKLHALRSRPAAPYEVAQ
jgi:tetratricopeptide (TPR) repeat protein